MIEENSILLLVVVLEEYMEKNVKIIGSVLAVSIILNMFSISLLLKVREQSNEYYYLLHQMNSDLNQVMVELNELKEENEWISEVEFIPNQKLSGSNEVMLSAEWVIKELESGATIIFAYKPIDENDWTEVEAKKVTTSSFQASLVIDTEREYEYQLSSTGDMQRGTEVMEIPSHTYKRAVSYSSEYGDNGRGKLTSFEIWLEQNEVQISFFKVKEARLYVTREDGIVKDEELIKGSDSDTYWNLRMEGNDIHKVELEVEFEDGYKKKREIYPNEEWIGDKSW
ncbi:hypothetical protein [Sutcliffiella halmapala]|uniref:hypothetical protein n=1 Tax=Sutcliffiella halmapala TaxID=79882 RepID=UPI000995618F|nr:hypothetical protein [Sutcliffiella halmapala]